MSLLIKGVQVISGAGGGAYRSDVLVQKNIISSIGSLKDRGADKVIEGLGNYLVPGFIDPHARSDHYCSIFSNPRQEDLLKQGVTSILGGACGVSLAPLLYGTPDLVETWSDTGEININWHSLDELLTQLEKNKLGINFGTLIGHSTLRRDIASDRKTLDKKELAVLRRLVADSLEEGAYGVSTDLGLGYGGAISSAELKEVSGAIHDAGAVHVIGLRDPKNPVKSVEEIIKLAQVSKTKVLIDGLRPTIGHTKEFKKALDAVRNTPSKMDVRFLLEPFETREIPIRTLLPELAWKNSADQALEWLRSTGGRRATRESLQNYDLRSIRVASAPRHHFLVGKTIKQIADNWGIDYIDAIRKIADISNLGATVFYSDISAPTLRSTLGEKSAIITADATGVRPGGGHSVNESTRETFPNFLRGVVSEGLLSLEDAIKRITSVPAQLFGLENRGLVEEGFIADLVILSKDNYEVRNVVLGGMIFGESKLRGEVLRHYG
jgi:N-acyl-D-amino-acid deacylase